MLISKLDTSRIQTYGAIEYFFSNNYTCAVTLAGAADGVFGTLLKASGKQSSFDFLYDWYKQMFKVKITKKKFSCEIANRARNWLKHAEEDADSQYDILEQDGILMLMRAVQSYYKLTKMHTEQMVRFKQYIDINPEKISALFS